MAVQTGTTYYYKKNVSLDYTCSRCGTHNIAEYTMGESVFTSILIQLDPNEEAQNRFRQRIDMLNNGPIPDRYQFSPIGCSCKNCGHIEPWSYARPRRVNLKLLWVPPLVIIAAILVIRITHEGKALPPILELFLANPVNILLAILASTLPYFIKLLKNDIQNKRQLARITKLPAQSLPVVRETLTPPTIKKFF